MRQGMESVKVFLGDLKRCENINGTSQWRLKLKLEHFGEEFAKSLVFSSVSIAGVIDQYPCPDVIILRDPTGRAKLSKCSDAETSFNKSQLREGIYVNVKGSLKNAKGLPEVEPTKICLTKWNEDLRDWDAQVSDFQLFSVGAILPEVVEFT